jgi:serine/threonine protein kinase
MVKQVSMKSLRHVRKIDDISKYYTRKTQLGAGKFGIVHEAVRVRTGGIVALKVVSKKETQAKDEKDEVF